MIPSVIQRDSPLCRSPLKTPANCNTAADLYLALLKLSLTNTIFTDEPNVDDSSDLGYVGSFIRHYIHGSAVTMLPRARMDNLHNCLVNVIERGIPGDVIETGVWRGGAVIFMRAVLKAYNVSDRVVWVADSFEGLPKPDADSFPLEAKAHNGKLMESIYNHFAVSQEEVERNFKAYGLLDERVCFLKGWFKDTLPAAPINTLAILRLDGDYYESTRDSLANLYDKVSPGGYVIIDDYGEEFWTYCGKAVDEFREEREIQDPLIRVDAKCFYWEKTC